MLTAASANHRRDLGDSLILRWSTVEDIDNIAQLVGRVFRSSSTACFMQSRFVPLRVKTLRDKVLRTNARRLPQIL